MTLPQFDRLMFWSADIRRALASSIIQSFKFSQSYKQELQYIFNTLTALPHNNNNYALMDNREEITLDLTYEINEMKKDITFLNHVANFFLFYVYTINDAQVKKEVKQGLALLKGLDFNSFITDRDGTINNYCGRYLSSIQSVYNSFFLSQFGLLKCQNSLILTSAPLKGSGLLDVSINPPMIFHYAGSKGREYMDIHGRVNHFPIEKSKQQKLDILNKRLEDLVDDPDYRIFSLIGSGLQQKYGQTTLARQDIFGTIPKEKSQALLKRIHALVGDIDKQGNVFKIEDTGKDIEIILTIENGLQNEVKDFDKGDGVRYLNEQLNLELSRGPNLICGDTESDLPMLETVMNFCKDTYTVFVTTDGELQKKVSSLCPHSAFVSIPDGLILLLHQLARERS